MSQTIYKKRPIPEWKFSMHMKCQDCGALLYRDEALKAQMEIVTEFEYGFPTDQVVTSWHLDGDAREFATEEAMVDALIEGPAELWVYAGSTRQKGGPEE